MPADIEHFHSFIDMEDPENKAKMAAWIRTKVDNPTDSRAICQALGLEE